MFQIELNVTGTFQVLIRTYKLSGVRNGDDLSVSQIVPYFGKPERRPDVFGRRPTRRS